MNNTMMYKEIMEESEKLSVSFDTNIGQIKKIAEEVRMRKIKNVVLVARGSSDNACVYFKYLCEVYAGLVVSFAAPSVLTLYKGQLNLENMLVIGVSQSGQALDVLTIIERANEKGALTVCLTNTMGSRLATAGKYHLYLNTGVEKSVAATKTFTAQMYLLAALAAELSDNDGLKARLLEVPELIKKTYALDETLDKLSAECINLRDCYFLGRGFNYVTVLEAALKLQETTYIKAKAYAISDFHHGPFAITDSDQNFFLVSAKGDDEKDTHEMYDQLAKVCQNLFVFTNDNSFQGKPNVILVPECAEDISPFVMIVAIQMFACSLSLRRRINPDQPRGLNKVTITK